MHTIDYILKRRSIRKFKDKLVPWDNVVTLIRCAINAPCAGNIFNVKFITIREPSNRKAVADACENQDWIATAPILIAVVAEPDYQGRYYGSRGERLFTIQNAAACTMSMIIAAESLGLATCWVGSFDEDTLRNVLGLSEHVNVHAILPIGFADEEPASPPKHPIKVVTYLEKWWAGRKHPSYGYYSDNVKRAVLGGADAIKKGAEKTRDAIAELQDKVVKKAKNKKEEKK